MNTGQWINPVTGRRRSGVNHYFKHNHPMSLCLKAVRPKDGEVMKVRDHDSRNCARCATLKNENTLAPRR